MICHHVPTINKGGKESLVWCTLDYDLDVNNVKVELYCLIGCSDVPEENIPVISCQFSKDPAKERYPLDSQWEYIRSKYLVEVDKKGKEAQIDITLPKMVCTILSVLFTSDSLSTVSCEPS